MIAGGELDAEDVEVGERFWRRFAVLGSSCAAEFDVEPGSIVAIDLPTGHWRTVYWALAAWAAVHSSRPSTCTGAGTTPSRTWNGGAAPATVRPAVGDVARSATALVSFGAATSGYFGSTTFNRSAWEADTGVATAPGVDFDTAVGHRFVRMSFAGSAEEVALELIDLA